MAFHGLFFFESRSTSPAQLTILFSSKNLARQLFSCHRQTREVRANAQRCRAVREGSHEHSRVENAKNCIEPWGGVGRGKLEKWDPPVCKVNFTSTLWEDFRVKVRKRPMKPIVIVICSQQKDQSPNLLRDLRSVTLWPAPVVKSARSPRVKILESTMRSKAFVNYEREPVAKKHKKQRHPKAENHLNNTETPK